MHPAHAGASVLRFASRHRCGLGTGAGWCGELERPGCTCAAVPAEPAALLHWLPVGSETLLCSEKLCCCLAQPLLSGILAAAQRRCEEPEVEVRCAFHRRAKLPANLGHLQGFIVLETAHDLEQHVPREVEERHVRVEGLVHELVMGFALAEHVCHRQAGLPRVPSVR